MRLHAPGFQRSVVLRGAEAVVVDLVWDRVPREVPRKTERDGIVLDPLEEILVN